MKILWILWVLAAVSSEPVSIPPQPVDGKIHWVYRYDEGRQMSRETGRPMFVVFRCEH